MLAKMLAKIIYVMISKIINIPYSVFPDLTQNTSPYFLLHFPFTFSGPAKALFAKSYYELLYKALRPGGIIISQGKMCKLFD